MDAKWYKLRMTAFYLTLYPNTFNYKHDQKFAKNNKKFPMLVNYFTIGTPNGWMDQTIEF